MSHGFVFFFDTETSGIFNYKQPYHHQDQPHIVQLGAILCDHNGTEISRINCIVQPDGWVIPPSITEVTGLATVEEAVAAGHRPAACDIHGISNDRAMKDGIPLSSALRLFNSMAAEADITVCHNADFDISMMMAEFYRTGIISHIPSRNLCTMKSTTELLKLEGKWGNFKWPKLQELHSYLFGHEFDSAHDAMVDVEATKRCYSELSKRGYNDWYFSRIIYGSQ